MSKCLRSGCKPSALLETAPHLSVTPPLARWCSERYMQTKYALPADHRIIMPIAYLLSCSAATHHSITKVQYLGTNLPRQARYTATYAIRAAEVCASNSWCSHQKLDNPISATAEADGSTRPTDVCPGRSCLPEEDP